MSTGKKRTPTAGAAVTVTDAAGRPVADGRTGPDGTWDFARPPAGRYRVAVQFTDHDIEVELAVPAGDSPATATTATPLAPRVVAAGVGALVLLGVACGVGRAIRDRRRRPAGDAAGRSGGGV